MLSKRSTQVKSYLSQLLVKNLLGDLFGLARVEELTILFGLEVVGWKYEVNYVRLVVWRWIGAAHCFAGGL